MKTIIDMMIIAYLIVTMIVFYCILTDNEE